MPVLHTAREQQRRAVRRHQREEHARRRVFRAEPPPRRAGDLRAGFLGGERACSRVLGRIFGVCCSLIIYLGLTKLPMTMKHTLRRRAFAAR